GVRQLSARGHGRRLRVRDARRRRRRVREVPRATVTHGRGSYFVWAALPLQRFLSLFVREGLSGTSHTTSPPSLHTWSLSVRMQSASGTSSAHVALTGPMLSVALFGASWKSS